MTDDNTDNETVELTVDIVSAYVSNNPVPASEVPGLISGVHESLTRLAERAAAAPVENLKPAVAIKKSVQRDHIVCLECGMKFKSLKRHLANRHDLAPEEYRERWKLPADYPMTAPSYSEARSALAKNLGLGRKARR